MDMDVLKLVSIIILADRRQKQYGSGWQKLHKQRLPKKLDSDENVKP